MPQFRDLVEANEVYREAFSLQGLTPGAARGLAVVTCIDSRIEPLAMLGLEPGDAKILRNAGARVTGDVLRSLVLAVDLLGVHRVAVVQHTNCKMCEASEDELHRIIEEISGAPTDDWEFLAIDDQDAVLRADLDRLRACPLLPDDMPVAGFIYDVETGELSRVT